jgi:hypothetical protein
MSSAEIVSFWLKDAVAAIEAANYLRDNIANAIHICVSQRLGQLGVSVDALTDNERLELESGREIDALLSSADQPRENIEAIVARTIEEIVQVVLNKIEVKKSPPSSRGAPKLENEEIDSASMEAKEFGGGAFVACEKLHAVMIGADGPTGMQKAVRNGKSARSRSQKGSPKSNRPA